MKHRFIFAALLPLCLLISGCKDAYGTCAKGSADVATAIGQGENSADQIRVQGLITSLEEKSVLQYLDFANTLNGQFQTCVKDVHTANKGATPAAYMNCVATFSTGLASPAELQAIHVSSQAGQQEVQRIANSIQAAVTGIDTALLAINGNKSGGQ